MIDPASRRAVGNTGVTVSRLGIGGGSSFMRAEGETGLLVDAAWQEGLRHFDTAPLYGNGESEKRLGRALSPYPRDALVLSTKAGREAAPAGARAFDYSASGIRSSILRSCGRMQTDRIDLAFIHDVDPDMHVSFEARFAEAVDEAYGALDALRVEGIIRAIGIGLKDWDVALRFAKEAPLDCIMLAGGYTLLQHGALHDLLPWCEANRVGVMLAAPFNSGILASGAIDGARYFYAPAPPEILERTRRIDAVCARHHVPLAAAALQFPLHHPAIVSVVVGQERAREVQENTRLLSTPIPTAMWAELKEQRLIPAEAPAG